MVCTTDYLCSNLSSGGVRPNVTHVPHRISCTVGTHASELPKTTFSGFLRCCLLFYFYAVMPDDQISDRPSYSFRLGRCIFPWPNNRQETTRCWNGAQHVVLPLQRPPPGWSPLVAADACPRHLPEPVLLGASVCSPDS